MLRALRKILFPFSLVYHAITAIRNKCYDYGLFKSTSFNIPVIVVGNLNVGGTGKSPMIEYLIRLLLKEYSLATLSRGYRRKTKGFLLANKETNALDIGDEPFQFYNKFGSEIYVAVDEERKRGIMELQRLVSPEVVLLDDAFQHRKVTAGFYVLLTTYNDPFVNDFILPAGNLRESRSGAKRADVVVVTKCPDDLSESSINELKRKIASYTGANVPVVFSKISYASAVVNEDVTMPLEEIRTKFTLVTGIANPNPLLNHLSGLGLKYEHIKFPDHHYFTESELEQLSNKNLIVTTEKDYVRLKDHDLSCYYLPIAVDFIAGGEQLNTMVLNYIKNSHKQENEA